MGRLKKGFTLIETVIVLALFLVIAGTAVSSMRYVTVSKTYEKKVIQLAVEDALVGYYGMMGEYPEVKGPDGRNLAVGTKKYTLSPVQIGAVINELNQYVGYTFGSKADIFTLMRRYQFLLSYPDKYTFKIEVVDR